MGILWEAPVSTSRRVFCHSVFEKARGRFGKVVVEGVWGIGKRGAGNLGDLFARCPGSFVVFGHVATLRR
jgi:hypothetical protein